MQPIEGFNLFNRYLGEWYDENEISLIQYNESKDMLKKLLDSGMMPNKCELKNASPKNRYVNMPILLVDLGIQISIEIANSGAVWSTVDTLGGFKAVSGSKFSRRAQNDLYLYHVHTDPGRYL